MKRPVPTSSTLLTTSKKDDRLGAVALGALGWLSTFIMLWLWVFEVVDAGGVSISVLAFSLSVALGASLMARR